MPNDDESVQGESISSEESGKLVRGHPLVGNAEPVPRAPDLGGKELLDVFAAQNRAAAERRLEKLIRDFPELGALIADKDKNISDLKAQLGAKKK